MVGVDDGAAEQPGDFEHIFGILVLEQRLFEALQHIILVHDGSAILTVGGGRQHYRGGLESGQLVAADGNRLGLAELLLEFFIDTAVVQIIIEIDQQVGVLQVGDEVGPAGIDIEQFQPPAVGRLVVVDQIIVAIALDHVAVAVPGQLGAIQGGDPLYRPHLFERAVRRDQHQRFAGPVEPLANQLDAVVKADHLTIYRGRCLPVVILDGIAQPAGVADEIAVDQKVGPGSKTINYIIFVFLPVVIDVDVAAFAAAVADAGILLQEPDPLLEAEIARGHGPDRADVDDVQGVAVIQRFPGENRDPGGIGPVDDAELTSLGDLPGEPDTAAAENAAFLVVHHPAAEIHALALGHLVDPHAAVVQAVIHVIVLQGAFSGLVADRAVNGMVDQFEFQHVALDLLDMLGLEQHLHPLLHRCLAGRHQRRPAVLDTHQAHAAVAVGAQSRVVTEVRNFDTHHLEGIDQVLARFDLHFLVVYKELHHFSHGSSFSH